MLCMAYLFLTSRLYTNLVTGIALLLGFVVPRGFNAPYLAINLADFGAVVYKFYQRLFIRDYVFISLWKS